MWKARAGAKASPLVQPEGSLGSKGRRERRKEAEKGEGRPGEKGRERKRAMGEEKEGVDAAKGERRAQPPEEI